MEFLALINIVVGLDWHGDGEGSLPVAARTLQPRRGWEFVNYLATSNRGCAKYITEKCSR